jgi:ribokinase
MSMLSAPSLARDVVVFGSLHLDIMVQAPGRPRLGETMVGQGWSMRAGGKGGNQAVEAARHGARTAMVGAVGTDDFGTRLIAHLRDHGVDTQAVRIVPGAASGMSVALVEPAGDYGAVIVSGVNLSLGVDDVASAAALTGGARWLLLQNEVPEAANIAAAEAAHRGGARVMLNAAPMRELPLALLAKIDGLVVNAVEAEALCGSPVETAAGAAHAAEALLGLVPWAIVTAGGHGLAIAGRDGARHTVPAHDVVVCSTHGAGDAFVGALAARLAAGEALHTAARYANAAAALVVATPPEGRAGLGAEAVGRLLAEV